MGQVVATALVGREGEGDSLDDPAATYEVDLWAFVREGRPTWARTRTRETHGDPQTRWVEQWTYVDGLGNVAQQKVRAEPGLAPQRDDEGSLVLDDDGLPVRTVVTERWVGNGRVIRNNKGLLVKQYEPFFSDRPDYEDEAVLVETGVTPVVHYDPMGRAVRTSFPDGTLARVEFSPWLLRTFDPGDTVLESSWHAERMGGALGLQEQRAAELSATYADTPSTTHLDHLGRAVLLDERNRWVDPDTGATTETVSQTRVTLDIEGNVLRVVDARDNVAQDNEYGPGGVTLHTASVDAGDRWSLAAVDGAPLRAWNTRGFRNWSRFDALRRPTHQFVRTPADDTVLVTRTLYGEALPNPEVTYHRGRIYAVYDGAGVNTAEAYDFAGNPLVSARQLATEYRETVDWSALGDLEDVTDLEQAAAAQLEAEVFRTTQAFDALGRPTSQTTAEESTVRFAYNEAALLERVTANVRGDAAETTYVENIDYDEKGRRQRIVYGNGTTTTYDYDPQTFRLVTLRTRGDDDRVFQALGYTYDAVGNIVEQRDDAQQTIYFNGEVVSPRTRYWYDARARLRRVLGREHAGQNSAQPTAFGAPAVPHPQDGSAMRSYIQAYDYDVVGNIVRMQHRPGDASQGWTRTYEYAANGNRLLANSIPGGADDFTHTYEYNEHGSMRAMPHLGEIRWDHAERMQRADPDDSGRVYFVYDAAGTRIRKVHERDGGSYERIYLGALELYRERNGGSELQLERETLHVSDDHGRICDVETRTVGDGASEANPVTHHRYQYSNHLGSAMLELTADAETISYEEYHPYGTSSYRAVDSAIDVSARRYRYTGMERDEETGLNLHGARYYAPWLGRWTAADPIGLGDGVNCYAYARGNPITLSDPSGTSGQALAAIEQRIAANESAAFEARGDELVQLQAERDDLVAQWISESAEAAKPKPRARRRVSKQEQARRDEQVLKASIGMASAQYETLLREADAQRVAEMEGIADRLGFYPTGRVVSDFEPGQVRGPARVQNFEYEMWRIQRATRGQPMAQRVAALEKVNAKALRGIDWRADAVEDIALAEAAFTMGALAAAPGLLRAGWGTTKAPVPKVARGNTSPDGTGTRIGSVERKIPGQRRASGGVVGEGVGADLSFKQRVLGRIADDLVDSGVIIQEEVGSLSIVELEGPKKLANSDPALGGATEAQRFQVRVKNAFGETFDFSVNFDPATQQFGTVKVASGKP